jgi:hypothetical protein
LILFCALETRRYAAAKGQDMKRLIALATLLATPAMAHPGHPVMDGSAGHLVAHLVIAASLVFVALIGASLLTAPLKRSIARIRAKR